MTRVLKNFLYTKKTKHISQLRNDVLFVEWDANPTNNPTISVRNNAT